MDLTGRIVQCDDFTNGVYHVFTNNSPVLNREVNQRYICIYFLLSILSCISNDTHFVTVSHLKFIVDRGGSSKIGKGGFQSINIKTCKIQH